MKLDVLVVDDHHLTREVLSLALEGAGYLSQTSSDGDEALSIIEEQSPGVVVTDYHMPQMNAMDLAKGIYRGLSGPLPRIVVVTADHAMGDRIANDRQFFAVLKKPVDVGSFVATIEEALRAR